MPRRRRRHAAKAWDSARIYKRFPVLKRSVVDGDQTPLRIRVLYLDPAWNLDDPLSGEFEAGRLTEWHGKFDALSYTWQPPFDDQVLEDDSIEVQNGVKIPITGNLGRALRRLRFQNEWCHVLWVDAICINQQNLEEQAQQVQHMAEIYSSAHEVMARIGEDSSMQDGKHIFELCQVLVFGETETSCGPHHTRRGVFMRNNDALWEVFASRRYFTRLWIVQELVHAGDIKFICGAAGTKFATFLDGMHLALGAGTSWSGASRRSEAIFKMWRQNEHRASQHGAHKGSTNLCFTNHNQQHDNHLKPKLDYNKDTQLPAAAPPASMKVSLLAAIPVIGAAFAAPAATGDSKAVSVRIHSSDGTESTHSVTLGEYVQVEGKDIDRIDLTSSASCTDGPLTCQPTWYFSSSGPDVGLGFTASEPGYPRSTFGNGEVNSVGLTCSCSPLLLSARDDEASSVLIKITNVDGTLTSGPLVLDEYKEFSSRDIAEVSIGGWSPGLNLLNIHCQPTWHFTDSGPIVGLEFAGNEAGTPDRVFGNGRVDTVGLRCSGSPSLLAREDKDGYITINVLGGQGVKRVDWIVAGQVRDYNAIAFKDTLVSVEIDSTDPDSEGVTCQPTWYFSDTGPVVGPTIAPSQPGSPDQTFGNGHCLKVSIKCSRSTQLVARADDSKPSVDIVFRESDGKSGSVTAPVGVGAGVNATGKDIVTLELGTGHGVQSSKVVCLPVWLFDTGASQAGSPLKKDRAAFLSDTKAGYAIMTKDRPKVTRVEVFCDVSTMKPRDAVPTIDITAHESKGKNSTASIHFGQAADLRGKNITSVEIKGADASVDIEKINCQPIWYITRGSGQLGYTFNSTNPGNPGYFLHGNDAVTRVAVTCA
ncbi:hypothetical protein CBER1_05454 [Cercospora berteroae]|uniref:Heterokaryon incompatibility domain-containing protein n=1 Tax=Cercospora berteroae TaxID=357750 RepID=A0A2S6C9N3_9PEZI|nr:hypothetical protein CBER1_05454 [Cercospora berteroae]